jgi:hypothetical protein
VQATISVFILEEVPVAYPPSSPFRIENALMAKLKLNLDTLQVESFGASDAAAAERGTVHGAALFAASKPSCAASCGGFTDPCLCDPVHPLTEVC